MFLDNHNSFKDNNAGASNRTFGFFFAAIFFVASLYLIYTQSDKIYVLHTLRGLSLLTLILSLFCPNLLSIPNRLWTQFGQLLSNVTTPIVVTLAYYLVITPAAILFRLLSKNSHFLLQKKKQSYWRPKMPLDNQDDYFKQQF